MRKARLSHAVFVLSFMAIVIGCASAVSAYDSKMMDVVKTALVHVSGSSEGSGVVISSEAGLVRIMTAKHVVENPGTTENAASQEPRPCTLKPTVRFQFNDKVYPSTDAKCSSDDLDFAVLEVPVDFATHFPELHEPGKLADAEGRSIFFDGIPYGNTPAYASGTIVKKDLQTLRSHTQESVDRGFSGGAALGDDASLLGIVLAAGGATAVCLPWDEIGRILERWKIPSNLLIGSPADPGPEFVVKRPQGDRQEAAREAVRQYRKALQARDGEWLNSLYPKLGRGRIAELFGDAFRLELSLFNCTDIDAADSLACAYTLNVYRRTGPPTFFAWDRAPSHQTTTGLDGKSQSASSEPRPMRFQLQFEGTRFLILNIDVKDK